LSEAIENYRKDYDNNDMIDLHTHSIYSDGNLSPSELLHEANNFGLSAIALTDHDTISGIDEFLKSAKRYPNIKAIPGVEFTCATNYELHILGLNIKNLDGLANYTKKLDEKSFEYAKIAAKYLDVNYSDLIKMNVGSFTWNEVMRYAVELGIANNLDDAYNKIISDNEILTRYEIRNITAEIIKVILANDGIPVLAHPKRTKLNIEDFRDLISELRSYGLKGIECYYSQHDENEIELYLKITKEFGLLVSGGSDYHANGRVKLGSGSSSGRIITKDILDNILGT
jgi:predicted metal-dependent phosphoesterase TrpH